MHNLVELVIQFLISFINEIGYFGIFIGMFLESTLMPIPSEAIMIPAGIAASAGTMNIYIAIIAGIMGNITGAAFSYYLAISFGRTILFRIGKYFLIKAETIIKVENFFMNHGHISIFIGRILPGFRHFISLIAGVAKMDLKLFLIYTTIGTAIWSSTLAALGFFIGSNQKLIHEHLNEIIIACALGCALIVTLYIFLKPARK